jgi:hypothetical protein
MQIERESITDSDEIFILRLGKWYKDSSWGIYVLLGLIIVLILYGIYSFMNNNHDGILFSIYLSSLLLIGLVNVVRQRKLIRIIFKLKSTIAR